MSIFYVINTIARGTMSARACLCEQWYDCVRGFDSVREIGRVTWGPRRGCIWIGQGTYRAATISADRQEPHARQHASWRSYMWSCVTAARKMARGFDAIRKLGRAKWVPQGVQWGRELHITGRDDFGSDGSPHAAARIGAS